MCGVAFCRVIDWTCATVTSTSYWDVLGNMTFSWWEYLRDCLPSCGGRHQRYEEQLKLLLYQLRMTCHSWSLNDFTWTLCVCTDGAHVKRCVAFRTDLFVSLRGVVSIICMHSHRWMQYSGKQGCYHVRGTWRHFVIFWHMWCTSSMSIFSGSFVCKWIHERSLDTLCVLSGFQF
jgi:hypothetical protein